MHLVDEVTPRVVKELGNLPKMLVSIGVYLNSIACASNACTTLSIYPSESTF